MPILDSMIALSMHWKKGILHIIITEATLQFFISLSTLSPSFCKSLIYLKLTTTIQTRKMKLKKKPKNPISSGDVRFLPPGSEGGGGTQVWLMGGTPSQVRKGLDGGTPCQDWMGVPPSRLDGYPHPPSGDQETEQLRGRRYASCVLAGGLSNIPGSFKISKPRHYTVKFMFKNKSSSGKRHR